jgi:hypothetical protein
VESAGAAAIPSSRPTARQSGLISDRFFGLDAISVAGTLRDSLKQQTELQPTLLK